MDDSCVVCADTLEWVAYGPCGHREVCSNCVIRLRFVCEDRRCCLCKCESNIIFVTKALGDYTKVINDFSALRADPPNGQVRPFWYHEGTQAFFDDLDQYKMVKAMCKLSCTVCQNDELVKAGSKRRVEFKNIDQLKSHLFKLHKLFFCNLCLEGRKVFICEQKLYNKAQLDQHIKTGDSKVDGSESERGGFAGHPMCEFCQNPFYGDNELYLHMSTEHFTCHICQRQHPGQYEYFSNYDGMEIHFRKEHFLCEDQECLSKKFVVFSSNSELKRHTAMEHGGQMSRSKRNATLQIPVSFQFQRSRDQNPQDEGRDALARVHNTPASAQLVPRRNSRAREVNLLANSFQSLATIDSESSSVHHKASQTSRPEQLEQSYFPPLATPSRSSLAGSSMSGRSRASRSSLHPSTSPNFSSSHAGYSQGVPYRALSSSFPSLSRNSMSPVSSTQISQPLTRSDDVQQSANKARASASMSPVASTHDVQQSANKARASASMSPVASTHISQPLTRSEDVQQSANKARASASMSPVSSTQISQPLTRSARASASMSPVASTHNVQQSANKARASASMSPVSSTQISQPLTRSARASASMSPVASTHDVQQSANKALVEKIRAALESDEDKYSRFKAISSQYRQGLVNTEEYLANVSHFGLAHLVVEIARLCPDAQKQKELVETYNFNLRSKGKEICDGNSKGKSKVTETESRNGGNRSDEEKEGNKPRKKVSKFLRNRLGDTAAEVNLNSGNCIEIDSGCVKQKAEKSKEPEPEPEPHGGVAARSVWQNGGGKRLVALTKRSNY